MNPAHTQGPISHSNSLAHWSTLLIPIFVAVSTVVHIAQPEFNAVEVALSFYMNGSLGRFLAGSLVGLGVASLMLSAAIRAKFGRSIPRSGLVLLATWGLGCIIGGLFPPDPYGHWDRPPSVSGMIHGIAAMIAFTSFPLAAFWLSPRLQSDPRGALPGLAKLSVAMTLLFFVCLAPVFWNRAPIGMGAAERIALAVYVCWLVLANRVVLK